MLPSFFKQSVTRLRPTETTLRGSTVYDWNNPSQLVIDNCSVQAATTTLDTDGRVLGLSEGLTAFLPYDSDVIAGDRILYNNEIYEIKGAPQKSISPSGSISSIKLLLMRWSG